MEKEYNIGKFLVVHYWDKKSMKGGCEWVMDTLADLSGEEIVTYVKALKSLNKKPVGNNLNYYRHAQFDRALTITQYLQELEKIEDYDFFLVNDEIGCWADLLETPVITVMQNPYIDITKTLHEHNACDDLYFDEYYHMYGLSQKLAYEKSYKVVVPSRYMKDYCLRNISMDDTKIKIINHGVDTTIFRPAWKKEKELREKYDVPLDKKVGAIVTKLHPSKYFHVPKLVKDFPEVHWVVVFGHKVDQKPKSENVTLLQNLSHEQMREVYCLSDFVGVFSPHESFNLSCVEAAACDTPIITTRTGVFWDWQANPDYEYRDTGKKKTVKEKLYDTQGRPVMAEDEDGNEYHDFELKKEPVLKKIQVHPIIGEITNYKMWDYELYKKAVERFLSGERKYKPLEIFYESGLTKDQMIAEWKQFLNAISEELSSDK